MRVPVTPVNDSHTNAGSLNSHRYMDVQPTLPDAPTVAGSQQGAALHRSDARPYNRLREFKR
jgi:hypothetical protein